MSLADLELEHETFTDPEPRLCACGCGNPLKEGAKRTYIHGHKLAMDMGEIPDDPEPSDEAKTKGLVRVTAKVRTEIQESVEAYLGFAAGAWAMQDPYCGNALLDQTKQISAKLVPILARNQMAVKYFRSSSNFKDTMDLFLVLWPVFQAIGKHHVFHTVIVDPSGTPQQAVDYSAFGA